MAKRKKFGIQYDGITVLIQPDYTNKDANWFCIIKKSRVLRFGTKDDALKYFSKKAKSGEAKEIDV